MKRDEHLGKRIRDSKRDQRAKDQLEDNGFSKRRNKKTDII